MIVQNCSEFSYYPFNVIKICDDNPFFYHDIGDIYSFIHSFLPLLYDEFNWNFKEPAFGFVNFLYKLCFQFH